MKPKKILLCVMPDPMMLSMLSFMLTTNGYRVLAANTAVDAMVKSNGLHFDLVLVTQDQLKPTPDSPSGEVLINRFKALQLDIHTLLFYEDGKLPMDSCADICVALPWRAADLLDRIKVITVRRRGPRPTFSRNC